jgi:adenosine deaminase
MVHEAVPKVELHCHLIGVLNSQVLNAIRAAGHPPLVAPGDVIPVGCDEGAEGFARWLVSVEPYKCADWKTFLPILDWHMERLVEQGVVYSELMISPLMFPRNLNAAVEKLAEFQQWVRRHERGRIQMEFLLLIPRSLPDEGIKADIERCLAFAETGGICGISIAGLEQDCPISRFQRMFHELKKHGLGIEIHAGERGGPEEVREALDIGLADRIGHGIAAFRDEHVVNRLRNENVHIEFCPTSNIKMGTVPKLEYHPIQQARDLGMSFSINTDDPGAFDCNLEGEFASVEDTFGFTRKDFQSIARNALAARFQPNLRNQSARSLASQTEALTSSALRPVTTDA